MKFVLILMVRNESKILERCLKAVEELVDAFCIHDTGSTDNTCEIAEEFLQSRTGCLTKSEWKDFGYNRTQSFLEAQSFVKDWKGDVYGLLLDADMIFHPGSLQTQVLTEKGYTVLQRNGHLLYPNTRLVRMDHPWTCRGVTHEYWDGPTATLDKSIDAWIQDENDGGCKSDKFERDARLLEEGLKAEPTNVRYMFYLAQTYHSLGRWKDAIKLYKQRYNAGGWDEERWYSLYMIGQSCLTLDDPARFEKYMLRAHAFRPSRAESLYRMAKYFREKGDHYKAYHYAKLGKAIPLSQDSLFIETDVYTGLFDYELTILLYYLNQLREGLRLSMSYMLTKKESIDNVYRNCSFYIEPLKDTEITHHPIMRDVCGRDYHPSSVSTCDGIENVRFVNYSINSDGGYMMKEGKYSADHPVRTQNVLWNSSAGPRVMDEKSVRLPAVPTHIYGLEDLRLYKDAKNTLKFIGTSREFSDKIRMVYGNYSLESATYSDCKVLNSPLGSDCEKNWIPISGTNDVIYSWNPLRIGTLQGSEIVFHTIHKTPWFFQHLRGSAIPIRVGGELWCLVHFVEHSAPRKYFHCIVAMDAKTYVPVRLSLPFAFRSIGIEYCLSMTLQPEGKLKFIVSSWDDNPCIVLAPLKQFEWTQV